MDDDIVSLIALTLIVNSSCRQHPQHDQIKQLTLSLYLMAQCQMKLYHPVTSLAQTLDYVEVACRFPAHKNHTLDQLLLKLAEQKLLLYMSAVS